MGWSEVHAPKADAASRGDVDAAEDLQEGGLAGTILPDEGVHFAGPDTEMDVIKGANTREFDRDVLDLEDGVWGWLRGFGRRHARAPAGTVSVRIGSEDGIREDGPYVGPPRATFQSPRPSSET
jgi:hypothetical protein